MNKTTFMYDREEEHDGGEISNSSSNSSSNVVEHRYTDHAHETVGNSFAKLSFVSNSSSRTSSSYSSKKAGGITVPFPLKLHEILDQLEEDGLASVISWQPHGRCFVVHSQKRFVKDVMAKYFRQTKFASFQRQLNLYGFNRLTLGDDKGGYYNELFLRGKRFLCHRIQRMKIKGTGVRKASSPETEPQFYDMKPVGAPGQDDDQQHETKHHDQHGDQGSSSTIEATPILPVSSSILSSFMGRYPQQQQNEQSAIINQAMLNKNQGYPEHSTSMMLQEHEHRNLLAAFSDNITPAPSSSNNIQDMQRMLLEQQAKLALAQNAIRRANSVFPVFPDMLTADAAQSLLQSMVYQPNQQYEMGDVADQIATSIRQKLREHEMAEHQQQQFASLPTDDDEDDESRKEFDQLLGALMGMPTEPPTQTQTASNPLATNTSLANLYETITD